MNKLINQNVLISVNNVEQRFKIGTEEVVPLKGVNFSILANSFNMIIGPSGSGKSTLLDIIAGLKSPSTGNVLVNGLDIYKMSDDELAHYRANMVGFVHQTNHWIKSLNVLENLSVPLFFLGYTRKKASKLAEIALQRVNMQMYSKKNPALLSGGEQQRIAMARALVNDPLFIIADEPTGNLDTHNSSMIIKLLLNTQQELRRTVILVTHNMEYITLADHLLKISDGMVEDIKQKDNKKVVTTMIKDMTKRIADQAELKNHVR